MRYLQIDTPHWPGTPLSWWRRFLQKVIPAANPNLQPYYSKTRIWWLEIDDDGSPQREIGFDADMNPVVVGPVGRNFGLLVDSSIDWSHSEKDSEEAARKFQSMWDQIWPEFEHLDK